MNNIASYILSAYSFIFTETLENLLTVGHRSMNGNPIPSFDENIIMDLCSEAQEIFEKEDNALYLQGDFIIVGDIHGSFHDLLRILNYYNEHHKKVLFLGDYVDRGNFSLECITILFALKIEKPDTFYLIRGNHEFDALCSVYGFKDEILNYYNPKKEPNTGKSARMRYDSNKSNCEEENLENDEPEYHLYDGHYNDMNCYKYTETLYEAFLKTFSYLPIGAIINDSTFCIHGGLSPKLETVGDIIKKINRPVNSFEENKLFSDIVWSDPSDKLSCLFGENPRGKGFIFNRFANYNFLSKNSLKRLIRAHECVGNGACHMFDGRCITVFSASSYDSSIDNSSGILELFQKDDRIETIIFPPLERLLKSETVYYKVQSQAKRDKMPFSLLHPIIASNSSVKIFSDNYIPDQNGKIKKIISPCYQSRLAPLAVPSFRTKSRTSKQLPHCPSTGFLPQSRPRRSSCRVMIHTQRTYDHFSDGKHIFSDILSDD